VLRRRIAVRSPGPRRPRRGGLLCASVRCNHGGRRRLVSPSCERAGQHRRGLFISCAPTLDPLVLLSGRAARPSLVQSRASSGADRAASAGLAACAFAQSGASADWARHDCSCGRAGADRAIAMATRRSPYSPVIGRTADARFSRHETASRRLRPAGTLGSAHPGQGASWENADG
jgi:hypothetical protein